MARIRTIKPEFWDSPGTGRASLRARLFFIAMWNWADDWGVGDAHPLRLLSFAFPNDESSDVEPRNFRHLAQEVAECFDVCWYEVDGRAYYSIPSWEEHQRTEKKARRKNPGPDQADFFLYDSAAENPRLRGGFRQDGRGKGEEGNRKKEVVHAHPPGARTSAPKIPSSRVDEMFDEFWSAWPLKKGKQPARKAFDKALKAGATLERILAGVEQYKREIGPSPDWSKVKYPQGWLNDARWEDEAPPAAAPTPLPDAYTPEAPICATGHRWLADGTCMLCTARKETT